MSNQTDGIYNMTPQQQLAFIREKAIEAVPSILDLKEGCRIKWENDIYVVFKQFDETRFSAIDKNHSTITVHNDYNDPTLEIIGRPIQLHDVLLAIQGKHITVQSNGVFIKLNPFNEKMQYSICDKYSSFDEQYHAYVWNLLLPLDGQKEEVWAFLAGLLK